MKCLPKSMKFVKNMDAIDDKMYENSLESNLYWRQLPEVPLKDRPGHKILVIVERA